MMHAFRSVRNHPIPHSFLSSSTAAPVISKGIRSFRSKGFASLSSQQESARIMDRAENPETGDVMYQFGHEYATRCEDEGFGVTHSIKQSEKDDSHGSNVEKKKETPAAEEKVQHRANK